MNNVKQDTSEGECVCFSVGGGAVATQNTGGKECLPGPAFCGYAM